MQTPPDNAVVEYIDQKGQIVATEHFYDPGLDPDSDYSRERAKQLNVAFVRHMTYGCGRPL